VSEKTDKKRSPSPHEAAEKNITATIAFLHNLPLQERSRLLAPNYTYLRAIANLPTEHDQAQFITQTLANEQDAKAFLGELFSLFKALVDKQLPIIFDAVQAEVLKSMNFAHEQ
jgi:hypothetical protein